MKKPKHNMKELRALQALPLEEKILRSQMKVEEFYEHYKGKICVSFSGGKDSTVLLHLVRTVHPEVKGVFVNTGLEYPEVYNHVLATENVDVIKPALTFREVLDRHGWCFPSKEVANKIYYARKGSVWAIRDMNGQDKNGNPCPYKRSFKKHKYLVDSPFKISNKCCDVMKKRPMKKYQREHGLAIVIGTMAAESALRRGSWIRTGCNAFNTGRSQPLSFWTEQDILRYIKQHNLTIPSVYGNIVEVDGKLSCTGESRTGCVFCPIGVHLDKGENKFQRLARTHPKLHHYCMYKLGLKDLLDFVGVDWREKRVQQQQLFGFY